MTTTRVKARYVIGFDGENHHTLKDAEVVYHNDTIVFVGKGYDGPVDEEIDGGNAILGPGFIDLNALGDLDTTVLAFDNQPDWAKGRVWPQDYLASGPTEMYSAEEQTFKMKYAFVQLVRNGITTALPITSMFYREWAETYDEFARSADSAAEIGIRAYLGPCYMTGVTFIREDGSFDTFWDEERGLEGLETARKYIRAFDGAHGGLVRGMLAPDRIENCTPELIRRSAQVRDELDCPIRLHCCQAMDEFETIVERYDKTPLEWLASLGFLSKRSLLPHGVYITGHSRVDRKGDDVGLLVQSGATLIHCPLVLSRYGGMMESFSRLKARGVSIGLGTDTFPPDMVENMRIGISLCRVAEHSPAACSAADFYNAATIVAANSLGRPDLGRLSVGAKADMTFFDLGAFELGQVIDPIQTMMLSGTGRDFKTVIINGRVVMKDRQLPGIDLDDYRDRAQKQFDRLIEKYPLRTWKHPPVEEIFRPAFEYKRL